MTRIFDKCSPLSRHPGLFSFHFCMYHGVLDPRWAIEDPPHWCRNTWHQPGVAIPDGLYIMLRQDVADALPPSNDARWVKINETFLFEVEFHLGETPAAFDRRQAAHIEKLIAQRSRALLPAPTHPTSNYRALLPVTVQDAISRGAKTRKKRLVNPFDREQCTATIVADDRFLNDHLVIATDAGFQVSEAVSAVLAPHTPLPYFAWTGIP